ncbi:MAG TPA: hypothetical protein VFA46_23930 [Actinomycetes bacterium]|jgi:hypothetical protein|nr:hypothetical protein [Actinomycetes bacterium]
MLPLGPNGYGEYLQPGRVTDCYLGILLDQPLAEIMPEPGRVLVVAPAALLHQEIPQPRGRHLPSAPTRRRSSRDRRRHAERYAYWRFSTRINPSCFGVMRPG